MSDNTKTGTEQPQETEQEKISIDEVNTNYVLMEQMQQEFQRRLKRANKGRYTTDELLEMVDWLLRTVNLSVPAK